MRLKTMVMARDLKAMLCTVTQGGEHFVQPSVQHIWLRCDLRRVQRTFCMWQPIMLQGFNDTWHP